MIRNLQVVFNALLRYTKSVLVMIVVCLLLAITGQAAVTVTAGSGGTNICSNRAVTGASPAFTSLGPIVITEGANADFSIGTSTIVLVPPSGWQFSSTLPTITYITGSNITGVSGSITATALTVNVTVVNNNGADQLTITGLQVQPLTTSATAGSVRASAVTGVAGITTGSSGTVFASLSVSAPVTPTVSISASPSGSFCPGTTVVFTPTSANGGTPTYYWALNGFEVSIGSTYSVSTLASGHTVSCRMISSLGCVTANPVFSNTITASVLTAPAAITGSATVCPTVATTLNSTTSGGTWSSSNTAVGTISSTGVLMGIAAGTTRVSYTVGSCSATRIAYVNNHPFAPVLTPTATALCPGTTLNVTAAGTPASTSVLTQNFNSGVAPWTVDTIGSVNILSGSEWKACADSYLNEQGWYRSPDSSTFVMANADTSGSTATLSTRLTSPVFSLAGYSGATISFQHSYDYWAAGDAQVSLQISIDGGSTWTTVNSFLGGSIGAKMGFVTQSFSLNPWVGNANVRIRFNYISNFGYYWAIDNIAITGIPGVVTPSWSPTTYLFTDPGFTVPYTGGATNSVYFNPPSVTTPTVITYTATAALGACAGVSTSVVTVNPVPGSTTGLFNICTGTSTTLSNSASGGTWVSSNPSVATIGSASGVVTGVAVGTTTISYITGTTCATVQVLTVTTAPGAVTGNASICLGLTSTLGSTSTGGTWTSNNTSIATVNATTGVVTGVNLGSAIITYSLGAGCIATRLVSVQPLPASVSGSVPVCAGQTISLSCATSGGTWISGNTAIATVGSNTGVVTGVSGGTVVVTYRITSSGCASTTIVTVNPIGPITGNLNACLGYTNTLSNTTSGGTWTSSNTAVATIGASSGIVTPAITGTSTISYSLSSGCVVWAVLTVNNLPSDITGPDEVCVGSIVTLSSATTGGTWMSNNTTIANAGLTTGFVSGVTSGSVLITYTAATSCFKTKLISVNPVPASITGVASICHGYSSTLSSATMGGNWSSTNASVAPVTTSGFVTGASTGTSTISYTLSTGCSATRVVTVHPNPSAISGTFTLCQGATTSLSSSTTGGTWTSSNTSVANVSSAGVVLGGGAGTATISYTLPTGCYTIATISVNPLPAGITGTGVVCEGANVTLASGTTGGSWTSSNTAVGTISATGSATGISAGTTTITYSLPTGCFATAQLTVNVTPAAIGGSLLVCHGATGTLTNSTTGGTWTSAASTIAMVGTSSGVVSGVSVGTTTVSYTLSTGCFKSAAVTVSALPATITGDLNICIGATNSLTNSTAGGSWSSSNTTVVSIGATTGLATGNSIGVASITYTLPTGCFTTGLSVVNPLPSANVGPTQICMGSTAAYANATSGGSWVSSNSAVLNVIGSTGVIFGVSTGTAQLSYILPTGCAAISTVTINALPSAIAGPDNVCQGSTGAFSCTPTGGTWSSSTVGVASIGLLSGVANGVFPGNAMITYTLPTGCFVTKAVSVAALPASISGSSTVCEGSSTLYTNITSGGSWSSSEPTVASISSGGLVTGVSSGSAIISYLTPVGCISTRIITVNPLPLAISGVGGVCIGSPVVWSNSTIGGTWVSANASIASVNATGTVNGFIIGTTAISYILPTGCFVTKTATVLATPATITGNSSICQGSVSTYTNGVGGGVWTSAAATIVNIGSSSGVATAASVGTTTLTYTLSSGCLTTRAVTVNPVPAAIIGSNAVCQGLSISLSSSTSGGTWSSNATSVASINSLTGLLNGITAGTSVISYTLPTGCRSTTIVTVYSLPTTPTGSGNVCLGSNTTLTTTSGGGTWASSNPGVASVDAGGVVSGLALGTANITYTIGIGCTVMRTVTVQPLPPDIAGSSPSCVGMSITLTNASAGGSWSSSAMSVATVGSSSGIVTPISAGTATITYTSAVGCNAYSIVTINTTPPISGTTSICAGSVSALSHSISGGTWSSTAPSIAGINATSGLMVGFLAGTATISYTIPGGCVAVRGVTVSAVPSAISGPTNVCPSYNVTLTNSTTGGVWSSTNSSVATISASGVVTGISPGITTISYATSAGCSVSRLFTVNPLPAAISGTMTLCSGGATTLSSPVSGGTWSSSNTAVATVSISGIVAGISAGTVVISYAPGSGCVATTVVTVFAAPSPISGPSAICNGTTATMSNATTGGSWSSSSSAVASINTSGIINGVSIGSTTISYTTGLGCVATRNVTVNASPTSISGMPSACIGGSTALSSLPTGGTWTSSNTAVAVVSSGGIVSGVTSGTATITYGFASGCITTVAITVSATPTSITGVDEVCVGSNATISTTASGGIWTSANAGIATVDAATGLVNGISAGVVGISYTIGSGCVVMKQITVNPVPAAISGLPAACLGMTTLLSNSTTGGVWSTSSPIVASVSPTTGLVSGLTLGTSIISYSLSTGCSATTIVSVNAMPTAISGITSVCAGDSVLMSNSVAGGIWSVSPAGIATVNSSGWVNGTSAGSGIVSYTLGAGCAATLAITVQPRPEVISGPTNICEGVSYVYSTSTSGGTWSVAPSTIASINITGTLSAEAIGTGYVTYTLSSGCVRTSPININARQPITGPSSTCVGFNLNLANTIIGGTWSSSLPTVATVGSATGIVTGLSAGTSTISYTLASGCNSTLIVTVASLTSVSGPTNACVGQSVTYTHAVSGGSWSISNPAIASIDMSTGVLLPIGAGSVVVSYTFSSGCVSALTVNVQPAAAIAGNSHVCQGQTTTLTNPLSGGSWTTSSTAINIDATTGVVTGINAGTAIVTYTLATGCSVTHLMTVHPLSAIVGPASICAGSPATFSSATTGGTWGSSSATFITINSVTGDAVAGNAGVVTISYALSTGCVATTRVTVNPLPAGIDGPSAICLGTSVTYSSATSSVVWSNSNSNATIDASTGIANGLMIGSVSIRATTLLGCTLARTVAVTDVPASISGSLSLCEGQTATLSCATTGGTWNTASSSIASIGASSGIVSATTVGTTIVSYILPSGCYSTAIVTVNALPSAITGPTSFCQGQSALYTSSTPGGTWTSSSTNISVASTTGMASGVSAGSAVITYTLSSGCANTLTVSVQPIPTIYSGVASVCTGQNVFLSASISGGTWSTSNSAILSVDAATGMIGGVATGTSVITYRLASGCYSTVSYVVNPAPEPILGLSSLCVGASNTLVAPTPGGIWSAGSPSVATVSATGVVSGISAGTANIIYTLPTGCSAVALVTVKPLPATIGGATTVCEGQTTLLTNTTSEGVWTSGTTAVASIDVLTGSVTGASAGTTVITYSLTTGCYRTVTLTVHPSPAAIVGSSTVCVGLSTTLTTTTTGGAWSSATPSVANINTIGVVSGLSPGVSTIFYTLPTGCRASQILTVNPIPPSIMGGVTVCPGATLALTNSVAGGSWSTAATTLSIDGTTGIVTGITAGTGIITYTLPTGCFTNLVITVIAPPSPIVGSSQLCAGSNTTMTNATPGGVWSASTPTVATITSAGLVSGLTAGTSVLSYNIIGGCAATKIITVNPLPPAIGGASGGCLGSPVALTNSAVGGTWSTSTPTVASVHSVTGTLTGLTLGIANITYTLPTGCATSTSISINSVPASISGTSSLCLGAGSVLSSSTSGGSWSSTNPLVATISSGLLASASAGTTIISYTLITGCASTLLVTVHPFANIVGPATICQRDTITFSNSVGGGSWSSSTIGVATVSPTGRVNGVLAGVAVISYSMPSGCVATKAVTVNPLPSVFTVSGGGSFCEGEAGVPIALNSSLMGQGYALYRDTTLIMFTPGTGSALSFGTFSVAGTYSVRANIYSTGCITSMAGVAIVTPIAIGPAGVTIVSSTSDTICEGTSSTFSTITHLGGSMPSYIWRVNGAYVSGASSYTYTPANGDIVSCMLSSSASCAVPAVATDTLAITVLPTVNPTVLVSTSPNDTICAGTVVDMSATTTGGGSAPLLQWQRNGLAVAVGATYSYAPSDGDVVMCQLISNAQCRSRDTSNSLPILFEVLPILSPTVTINALPGFNLNAGQTATFNALVANAGIEPTYSWRINGSLIAGATSSVFTYGPFSTGDVVNCSVTAGAPCGGATTTVDSIVTVQAVGIGQVDNRWSWSLQPNPNNGQFRFVGAGLIDITEVTATVTDLLGRQLINEYINVTNGVVNATIDMPKDVANGSYLLSVHAGSYKWICHFVVVK